MTRAAGAQQEAAIPFTMTRRPRAPHRRALRLIRKKPLGAVGMVIMVVFFVSGLLSNVIAPYGYSDTNILENLQSPSLGHPFGTDDLGRDVLSRVIHGARISIIISLTAVSLGTGGALILGTVSAYNRGWVDMTIQRFVDAYMAFPGLVILLTLVSIFQPGIRTLIIALALGEIFRFSRIVRSTVFVVQNEVYVEAAVAVGATPLRIIVRYIFPNIMAVMLVIVTVSLGSVILIESTLSFLGLGIPPPHPSWGRMLAGQGAEHMQDAPWMAIFPGIAIGLAVFGFNMAGDALRDVLDPRLRGA